MKERFLTAADLRPRADERLLAVLYVGCIAVAAMGDCKHISNGSVLKVFTLGAVALAMLSLLITADGSRFGLIFKFALVFALPLLFVYVLSLIIWAAGAYDVSYIERGSSKLIYQAITVFTVLSGGLMFGKKTADYLFYGYLGGNAFIVLYEMKRVGVAEAVRGVIEMFRIGENSTSFTVSIEVHDLTFAMGMFALYYLFRMVTGGFSKGDMLRCAAAAIFFLLGFKRIALFGIAVAIAALFLLLRLKEGARRVVVYCAGAFMLVFCYVYIYVITEGIFTALMNRLGVDMMGRDTIYEYVGQFYEFTPAYLGRGFEYTVSTLRGLKLAGENTIGVEAIHNDILRQFIELGFWGFGAWAAFTYVYQLKWFGKNFSDNAALLVLVINVYTFLTYLTDNTIYYFWLSMAIKAALMSYSFAEHEKNEKNLKLMKPPRLTEEALRSILGAPPPFK